MKDSRPKLGAITDSPVSARQCFDRAPNVFHLKDEESGKNNRRERYFFLAHSNLERISIYFLIPVASFRFDGQNISPIIKRLYRQMQLD
jgi:hypothetical protein